jgi:hypothetical protein
MPLPPISNIPTASPSRRLRDQLLDTEGHLGQHLHHLAQGTDGYIYLTRAALQTHQVDVEPFPRTSPRLHLDPAHTTPLDALSEGTLNSANRASLAALEGSFQGWGIHELIDDDGQHLLARAHPVGPRAVHRWQVVWLGSRKEWLVTKGSLHWTEGTVADNFTSARNLSRDFPNTFLSGQQGWITLPCQILPESFTFDDSLGNFSGGYRLSPPPRPVLSPLPPTQSPPIKTINFSGVLQDEENPLIESQSFTAGTLHLPIAWVSPPNSQHRTPQIIPFATNDIQLSSEVWLGSLPLPSMF